MLESELLAEGVADSLVASSDQDLHCDACCLGRGCLHVLSKMLYYVSDEETARILYVRKILITVCTVESFSFARYEMTERLFRGGKCTNPWGHQATRRSIH